MILRNVEEGIAPKKDHLLTSLLRRRYYIVLARRESPRAIIIHEGTLSQWGDWGDDQIRKIVSGISLHGEMLTTMPPEEICGELKVFFE